MKPKIRVQIAFLILLSIFSTQLVHSQIFQLKGNVKDEDGPIAGISLLINRQHVGNSDRIGNYQVSANVGDTLEVISSLYHDYQVVLKDTLPQHIGLQKKEFQLAEVHVNFDQKRFIDSVLSLAFSKLENIENMSEMFLRQSVTENNSKTVLLNEGLVTFLLPVLSVLSIKDGYKQIKMNVIESCSSIIDSTGDIIYASNPQIRLRMGLVPDYFYRKLVPYINHVQMKTDLVSSIIDINGVDTENGLSINYSYLIDRNSGALKQIKYYSEGLRGGDFFFAQFNYEENRLISVLSSAKQIRKKQYFSTNDELFITKANIKKPEKWNFNERKCGLHQYINENGKCDSLVAFKVRLAIPKRSFF